MIIYLLLQFLVTLAAMVFYWFPNVDTLPFGIDSYVATGIGGIRALSEFFPPFGIVLNAFIFYLFFRLSLKIFKVIPVIGKVIHD